MKRWLGVVPCLAGVAFPVLCQTPGWQAGIAKLTVDSRLGRKPGSGVVVAVHGQTAYLVTCSHVVEGDVKPKVEFVALAGRTFTASRKHFQEEDKRGLALLEVNNAPGEVRAVPLAARAKPVMGEKVVVAGFPADVSSDFTVVDAIISNARGTDITLSRETGAGFSGGPVLRGDTAIGLVYGYERGFGLALLSNVVVTYLEGLDLVLSDASKATEPPARGIEPKAGDTKVNPKDGLTYVWVPPGAFLMGCSLGDRECADFEHPSHPVTLTKGFWLGQTPVTQAAYQKLIGKNPSHFKGDSLPVENVSWEEASAYCKAAGGRLPTEAEWEYAARAGSTGARYGELDAIAWYVGNSQLRTHEVGGKLKNGFGLYDMLGNVWEWTADWYGTYTPEEATDPKGPASGSYRVLRGGSWDVRPKFLRVSYRSWVEPVSRYTGHGFRCAWE